ncbi:MAG TPA: hypothetical protein VK658_22655 [Chryseolinea sp.]|nr:hypothetical protein [Chryseolinea sp.]
MEQTNSTSPPQVSLGKQMLIGAWVGLLLISFFLMSADEPNPAWGKLWPIRPLIIVTLAGAMAGVCNYLFLHYHHRFRMSKTVAVILSVIVSLIGLWMGVVLGLDGTLWN